MEMTLWPTADCLQRNMQNKQVFILLNVYSTFLGAFLVGDIKSGKMKCPEARFHYVSNINHISRTLIKREVNIWHLEDGGVMIFLGKSWISLGLGNARYSVN